MPAKTRVPISRCGCQGGSLQCGAISTYRVGCGCDPCRAAHNARISTNAARRRQAQSNPEIAKRLTASRSINDLDFDLMTPTRASKKAPPKRPDPPTPSRPATSGPEWREKNLGPWCEEHHDWAFREGAVHDQATQPCRWKDD